MAAARRQLPAGAVRAGAFAVLVALWQTVAVQVADPLLPTPVAVLASLFQHLTAGELLHHLGVTLLRVAASFALAMTVGVAVGVWMGRSPLANNLFDAALVLMLNLPALVTAIEQAFEAQPALLGQGIERMAAALGLHPRTLQRRLADHHQGYAELQDRARFRLATALLADRALDLETISERLGFSDRRSFTRAFSRWAGCSPSAFRDRERR